MHAYKKIYGDNDIRPCLLARCLQFNNTKQ